VHYTSAVGQTFRLDLGCMLSEWTPLPASLRKPMEVAPPAVHCEAYPQHYAPPEKAGAIAQFLLAALAPTHPTRAEREAHARRLASGESSKAPHERASASIAALAERVREMGWLAPFHGLARWGAVTSNPQHHDRWQFVEKAAFPWLPRRGNHVALHYAWCVCAVSYISPPLILWTRQPSLTWWRGDNAFDLRWFGGKP
jgi:hypothetical protein